MPRRRQVRALGHRGGEVERALAPFDGVTVPSTAEVLSLVGSMRQRAREMRAPVVM